MRLCIVFLLVQFSDYVKSQSTAEQAAVLETKSLTIRVMKGCGQNSRSFGVQGKVSLDAISQAMIDEATAAELGNNRATLSIRFTFSETCELKSVELYKKSELDSFNALGESIVQEILALKTIPSNLFNCPDKPCPQTDVPLYFQFRN